MGCDARPAQRSEVWNGCATELSLARRVPAVGIVHRTEPQIQHTQFRTSSILYRFANKIRRTKLELVRRRCSQWCSEDQMKTVVLAGGLGTWLSGISDSSSDADTGRRHGRHGKVVSKALSLRTQFAHSTVLDFFFGQRVGKADWERYGAANLCELLMAEMIICPTED
jgi:hypothetical protein